MEKLSHSGPLIILTSILLGSIPISLGGRTPNLFWCDTFLVLFIAIELISVKREQLFLVLTHLGVFRIYFIFIILCAISLMQAEDPTRSIAIFKLRLMPLAAIFYILFWLGKYGDWNLLLKWISTIGVLLAILIIWNFRNAIGQGTPGNFIDQEVFSTKDLARTSFGRSNYLASMLIILFPIAIAMFQKSKSAGKRVILGGVIGLYILAIFITQSRGAIISLLVGLFFVFLIALLGSNKRGFGWFFSRWVLGTGLAVLITIFAWSILPEDLHEEFSQTFSFLFEQFSDRNLAGNRADIWKAGLSHAFDKPIFGMGLGNQAMFKDSLGMYETTHNLWLDTHLELGLLGLVSLCGFLIRIFMLLLAGVRKETDNGLRTARTAVFGAMIIAMFNAFQEPSYWGEQYTILLWFILGIGFLPVILHKPSCTKVL